VSTTEQTPHAGAPFGAMLRGALLPATVVGLVAVIVYAVASGGASAGSAALGLVVTILFFASGMALLNRLVRSASPHAFFAVAMAVYLGQVLLLLLFIIAFKDVAWVDGPALGITAFVVTIAWQIFAMRALRRARIPVYDEPAEGSR
jgi:ATP synthase protein I